MHLSQYFGESDLSRDLLPKAYGSDVLRAALGSLGAAPSIVLMNKLRAVCGPILELPEVEGDLDSPPCLYYVRPSDRTLLVRA